MRGSGWRGSDSWVFRLYVMLQVLIWTAQICTIPRFPMRKTYVAVRASAVPDVTEGRMISGDPEIKPIKKLY